MSLGIIMGPIRRVPRITLGQEHIPKNRLPTVALEPSDGLRHAILALPEAKITHTLGHALYVPGPTNPVKPTRARKRAQYSIPSGQPIHVVAHRRPTLLEHHSLVLNAKESGVVVLDVASLELERSATGLGAKGTELSHCSCDARGAVGHGEVAAALEEAVDDVVLGGAGDGEVVVGGVGGRVDQGGE